MCIRDRRWRDRRRFGQRGRGGGNEGGAGARVQRDAENIAYQAAGIAHIRAARTVQVRPCDCLVAGVRDIHFVVGRVQGLSLIHI